MKKDNHKKGKCLKCGNPTSRIKCIRCLSCSNKYREKIPFKWSEESKNKRKNEGNPQWKGNKVGYYALHQYIKKYKTKLFLCENCNKKMSYDLANISGEYKRDINDYRWLCRSCHMKKDGRLDILQINKKKFMNKILE